MATIKNYALCQAERPEDLVKDVTKMISDGFQPLAGVSAVREPAMPLKGMPLGRTLYVQAMIRLHEAGRAPGLIVNGR